MNESSDRKPTNVERLQQLWTAARNENPLAIAAILGSLVVVTLVSFLVCDELRMKLLSFAFLGLLVADAVIAFLVLQKPVMRFIRWYGLLLKSSTLTGRWWPENPEEPWIEFGNVGTMTTATGEAINFEFAASENKIKLRKPDGTTDEWSVMSLEGMKLVVHANGKTTIYRKSLTKQAERLAGGVRELTKTVIPEKTRADLLVGKWDLVGGDNFVQFTKDGAIFRADGFVARYELVDDDQALDFSLDGKRLLKVPLMSLSKHELVLSDNGLAMHFQRGTSISEAEMKKARDAFNAKLMSAGKTAATVAAGIGVGILAMGAVGALAAAATGGKRSELPSGPRPVREEVCRRCNGKGWENIGSPGEKRCLACGGQGVKRF